MKEEWKKKKLLLEETSINSVVKHISSVVSLQFEVIIFSVVVAWDVVSLKATSEVAVVWIPVVEVLVPKKKKKFYL